jgi:hypothetical protein
MSKHVWLRGNVRKSAMDDYMVSEASNTGSATKKLPLRNVEEAVKDLSHRGLLVKIKYG